ncbi:hypothetical protein LCGC14_2229400 [marine sediment metagenome]|uniref:Zona occludens toxin N-terminal domain-containing protein n=1 Tax=marine sediment metagenome TaxID=412755 RepID=A0A0F9DWC5_9ZZZZ
MPHAEAIAHYPKSTQVFIKKIHNRIESGKNALIAVVGGTGSGKSWSTLNLMVGLDLYRFGKMKEAQWYIDHCIFRAKDLLKGLNDPKLKKKTTWIWDEAGVDAGSQEHMSTKNKVIGWMAQTFRNLQQVVFFTLPTLGMLTSQVRKLLHYYLEAHYVDSNKQMCVMKPLQMQYNTRMDKIYYHNLKFTTRDGFLEQVQLMGVPKAPQDLIDGYEELKSKFTSDLNLQLQQMLEKMEKKDEFNPYDRYTDYQKEIHKAVKEEGKTNVTDIANFLGRDTKSVSLNLMFMKKKGGIYQEITRKNSFRALTPPST